MGIQYYSQPWLIVADTHLVYKEILSARGTPDFINRWDFMKQKVVIRAIISQHERVLLLKRYGGRHAISGLYELPGGSLHSGEQPSDALMRSLQIHTGLYPESFRLRDVVSFIDPDDRGLQYLFIVYKVSLPSGSPRITLDDEYSQYAWKPLQYIQQNLITNSTGVLLNIGYGLRSNRDYVLDGAQIDDKNTTVIIYSDGGSRGNPGPSASAFIILNHNDHVITEGGKFLGLSDSGMAEYLAVELAIDKAIGIGAKNIEFRSDSLMVVNQLNGLFAVKNHKYRTVHDRILQKTVHFKRINFRHVHREYNRMADGLVNKILDENMHSVERH